MNNIVMFTTAEAFAAFVAELVRQGVTFTGREVSPDSYEVRLLGGF